MGAFFLYHKDSPVDLSAVEEVYVKKGFGSPHVSEIGDYRLYLYRKQLLDVDNYLYLNGNAIYACGSFFYRQSGYRESLKLLLEDFLKNELDSDQLYGNYVFIFFCADNNKLSVYTDAAVLKNVYCDKEARMLSTDFLAIISGACKRYSLNMSAIIESLTTGNLISPDTYVAEIERIDKISLSGLDQDFPGIRFALLIPYLTVSVPDKDYAIQDANDRLETYFKSAAKISGQFKPHLGLTGGFDARLLLVHARKHLQDLITNSFWRPASTEYKNAKLLAEEAGTRFISFEKSSFEKPPENEMTDISYYFFDGQVRSQNNWMEEFNLPEYSERISAGHYVGFHGCGGEQYRNSERILRKIRFDDFVYYDWMFRQCSNVFTDRMLKQTIHDGIKNKINRLTSINRESIGFHEIKRIQNEVWIPSNRMTRVNVLNQQQFYFAPFTEYHISYPAYSYIPFLGESFAFEIDLIRNADRKLASLMTNYGYTVLEGEPIKSLVLSRIAGNTPRPILYKAYGMVRRRRPKRSATVAVSINLSPPLSALEDKIDFDRLGSNKNLGWGIVALNEFICRFYKLQNRP